MKNIGNDVKTHLLTGVSYMLPFVVAGGLILTIGLLLQDVEMFAGISQHVVDAGVMVFGLMIPVLSAYIAFSIADRPSLAPGMAGGMLAATIGAGFLGGIVAGFVAGYVTNILKKIPMHQYVVQLLPIIIIPLLGTTITLVLVGLLGIPIAAVTVIFESFLTSLSEGSLFILGLVIGGMMAVDMGGPINKVAFAFCVGLIDQGVFAPMAACWIGIMTPPIGLAVATLIAPHKFTEDEKASRIPITIMGLTGVTEGAIPFAVREPLRVIPALVIGSAAGGGLALLLGAEASVPSGGIFVVPFFVKPLMFLIAFVVAIIVTAVCTAFFKTEVMEEE